MIMRWCTALVGICICAALCVSSSLKANTAGAGSRHTVVVTPNGTVWAWGGNSNGQLGDGTTTDRLVPTAVPSFTNVTAVAAGSLHTLALKSDGSVWAWGFNGSGQLGDGTTSSRSSPVVVSTISSAIAIAAGDSFSVALTSDGHVWTWGANGNGQLGDGTTTGTTSPHVVSTISSVSAIGAGSTHTLAVKTDGTAWAWGANGSGQLGDSSTTQRTLPVQMSGITGASAVAGGSSHSLVLKSDGTMKATGNNASGQLGDGTTTQRTSPVSVSTLTSVGVIAAGQTSSYALKTTGTVWGWGSNGSGRLGDGTTTNHSSPTQASSLSSITILTAGLQHALAVSSTGVVWTWGNNFYGQLGDGTTLDRATPVAISDVNYAWKVATPVLSVASGTYSTEKTVTVSCATAGATIHYTLDGTTPTENDQVIASGSTVQVDHSLTLTARAWKTSTPTSDVVSAAYTLQVATVAFSPSPTTYTSPQSVTLSTTSPSATIRYTTDGSTPTESSSAYSTALSIATSTTIKAIGFRSGWTSSTVATGPFTMNFGTLAAPTLTPATGTSTTEADVTMSAFAGAAIHYTTDGTIVQSTSPLYTGPVGITTTTTINAKAFHPDYTTSPQTSATYTIVVATPTFSLTAGTYAAGQIITVSTATPGATLHYTLTGQNPTSSDPIVPANGIVIGDFTLKVAAWKTSCTTSGIATASYQVTGDLTTPAITGGDGHSVAVRNDGVYWTWGLNGSGQLGDGTTTQRTLPVIVGAVTGAVAPAAGSFHSLAVRSDGSLLAWGGNSSGQLGDGTTTGKTSPLTVPGLSSVVAASGGANHSLALLSDGTVRAFGLNNNGQLGDGTTTQRTSPVQASALSNITGVSAGATHSLAVKSDGTAWSWGTNGNGQLGTGNTTSRSTPGQVSGLTTAVAVAAGNSFSLARLSDGTVKAWGFNSNGQLGDGSTIQRTSPVATSGLTNITAIAVGNSHALALKNDGTVWAWGLNGNGQVGDGTTTNRTAPVAISGLPAIVAIGAGQYHSLAIASDGSVWAWGKNTNGQLGDGTTTQRTSPVEIADASMAWKVAAPVFNLAAGLYTADQNVTVTEADPDAIVHYTTNGANPTEADDVVASGNTVAVGVSLTLKARAWKPGAVSSEVTSATYELKALAPTFTPGTGDYTVAQNVTISTATSGATLTYTTDGTEPMTGSTPYGGPVSISDTRTLKARAFKTGWTSSDSAAASYWIPLGTVATPTIAPTGGPHTIMFLVTLTDTTAGATVRYTVDGTDPTASSTQYQFPFLVDRSTTVKAKAFLTGYNPSPVGSASYSMDAAGATPLPSIVPAGGRFATKQTVTISGPSGAVVRYTTNGADPVETDPVVPGGGTITVDRAQIVKARAWLAGSTPSAVERVDFLITGALAAGHDHTVGLASDGTVWAWGRGTEGQLGNGGGATSITPVVAMSNAIAISGGLYHSLAVRDDGTAWAWGRNESSQLGDGTTSSHFMPVQVAGLTNVVAVAAGYDHSLALKNDGTVWAWGYNGNGQLGDGTTTSRTTPVQVLGLAGVTAIAAGDGYSLAIERDGGAAGGLVWAWGKNASGQVGDGSTTARSVPVHVLGITNAQRVVAGRAFGVALLADGTVQAWGANDTGQLGNLSGTNVSTPTAMPGLTSILTISAGVAHALATDDEGRVWGWGTNTSSQFGLLDDGGGGLGAPRLLMGFDGAYGVASGSQDTLVLRADGTVWAIGTQSGTGLGTGTYLDPSPIPDFSLGPNDWLLDDADADGLPSWREYLAGTDPLLFDSNGNGLSDLIDVLRHSQTANPDDDGDGVPNALELAQGTDPFMADTDGDGVSDLLDAFPLDPTRHDPPTVDPNDHTPPVITLTKPVGARPVGGGGSQ